jgi:lysophospholipase-2
MPAWFDIKGLDVSATEDVNGIKNATVYVHSLIEKEITEGIPSERIIVGGFSQGGALAIYSALTFPKKLAGIIALSCWLPLSKTFSSVRRRN